MKATLNKTQSSLEQLGEDILELKDRVNQISADNQKLHTKNKDLERDILELKDWLHRIGADNQKLETKSKSLEEKLEMISIHLHSEDVDHPDTPQVDSADQTLPYTSDTDNVYDEDTSVHGTLEDGTHSLDNPAVNESNSSPVVRNRIHLLGLFERELLRGNDRSHIVNTKTIHIYALSVARDCAKTPTKWGLARSWFISSLSFLLVCSQVILLIGLMAEASHPSCATHTDCSSGLFCEVHHLANKIAQPRCSECLDDFNVAEEECVAIIPNWKSMEVDETIVWYDKSSTPYIHFGEYSLLSHDENEWDEISHCLAWKHCNTTKIAEIDLLPDNTCPHLRLKMAKLSNDQLLCFIFVSILFASILSQDIEEAAVENVLLEFSIQSLPNDKSMHLSAFVIRLSNRMRMYVLPVLIGSAGCSIILSEDPTAKNILLNVIAVLFITEADNLLASFLLSPDRHLLADSLVRDSKIEGCEGYSFVWTRTIALLASTSMVIATLFIEPMIKFVSFFGSRTHGNTRGAFGCNGIAEVFFVYPYFIFGNCVQFYFLWILIMDRKKYKMAGYLLEVSRIMSAGMIFFGCVQIFLPLFFTSDTSSSLLPMTFANLVANTAIGARCEYVIKNSSGCTVKGTIGDIILYIGVAACGAWFYFTIFSNITGFE